MEYHRALQCRRIGTGLLTALNLCVYAVRFGLAADVEEEITDLSTRFNSPFVVPPLQDRLLMTTLLACSAGVASVFMSVVHLSDLSPVARLASLSMAVLALVLCVLSAAYGVKVYEADPVLPVEGDMDHRTEGLAGLAIFQMFAQLVYVLCLLCWFREPERRSLLEATHSPAPLGVGSGSGVHKEPSQRPVLRFSEPEYEPAGGRNGSGQRGRPSHTSSRPIEMYEQTTSF